MTPETRRRSRSRSDATDLSKGSAAMKERSGKRDREESGGDHSIEAKEAKKGKKKTPKHKGENTPTKSHQKQTPTMDVIVHRMRYLNFHPKSILAMKATPSWSTHSLLAISRENGYVEVKSVDDRLRTIGFLAGYRKRPVTSLAWVRNETDDEPLLIGASRDGSIFHVNFAKQAFTNVTASGGGGVFALETLSSLTGCENCVAAACEDGSVRIFQYHETGSLLLISTIPSCGAPVLSLAWRKKSSAEKGLNGLTMFAAVADGTIRRFDGSSNNERLVWKSANRMTVESRGRNIPTRVWALKALQDGTLVSANSLGQVQFWDGETGSLELSMEQTATQADVLGLAVNADESKVFASGVDSRVMCMERRLGPEPSAWIITQSHRGHTHDVKSLEICSTKSALNQQSMEILFSGGLDTKLCTYHVANFSHDRPRVVYPWPTSSPFSTAAKARMLAVMREQKVELFRLADSQEVSEPVIVGDKEAPVGTVEIRDASNLVCAGINSSGKYLAVANMVSFYLFSLSFDKKGRLHTKRIPIAADLSSQVSAIKFTNDDTLVLSCTNGSVCVIPLAEGSDEKQTVNWTKLASSENDFPIHRIANSPSGSLIAAQSNTLKGGTVEVFSVEEDGFIRPLWTLPTLDTAISTVSFVDENRLAIACVDYALVVFDIKEQRLNKWNQDAGTTPVLPKELKRRNDFPAHLLSDPGSPNKVIMASFGMFVVFDLDQPLPTVCETVPGTHVKGKKRKGKPVQSKTPMCIRYSNILHLDFVDKGEMVVVEQPWLNVLATMPAALTRRVYGT